MLGEPTYMKYDGGGSVGHAPWLQTHWTTSTCKPTNETPTPHVASRPESNESTSGNPECCTQEHGSRRTCSKQNDAASDDGSEEQETRAKDQGPWLMQEEELDM